ncbi:hypothetical protein M4D52_07360 [Paenibacillus lactis]|uniref:phage tail terminator family protein n=1 Tax=Paenibacillus TaxID=44249 RepID=UPI00204012AD|nr:hypothetical protein [Paenibacillus lactis]MCM3493257.1 hypothetical protein [Paenibacillus lactis]
MVTQKIQASLKEILHLKFSEIITISKEDAVPIPEPPYFHTELALAEFEPISQRRYAARFRFRIFYVPAAGQPVAGIMDEMLESLTELEVGGRPCRAAAVAWERPEREGAAAEEGYFRAEYVIQVSSDSTESVPKMQTLQQGGGLK